MFQACSYLSPERSTLCISSPVHFFHFTCLEEADLRRTHLMPVAYACVFIVILIIDITDMF